MVENSAGAGSFILIMLLPEPEEINISTGSEKLRRLLATHPRLRRLEGVFSRNSSSFHYRIER